MVLGIAIPPSAVFLWNCTESYQVGDRTCKFDLELPRPAQLDQLVQGGQTEWSGYLARLQSEWGGGDNVIADKKEKMIPD